MHIYAVYVSCGRVELEQLEVEKETDKYFMFHNRHQSIDFPKRVLKGDPRLHFTPDEALMYLIRIKQAEIDKLSAQISKAQILLDSMK